MPQDKNEICMKGNTNDYPGAYIEFRLKVDSITTPASGSVRGSIMTSQIRGGSALDEGVQMQVDEAIDNLRSQYQPKIEALNDIL